MHRQSLIGLTALLVTALACRDDTTAPTHVVPSSSETTVAAAAALIFWQLSAGDGDTCGITADNRAYCWGANGSGQLGNGTQTDPDICGIGWPCSTSPVAVLGVYSSATSPRAGDTPAG